jgi:phytol kinase
MILMFRSNLLALGVTLVIALAWLRINDFFAHKGWISSGLSRKIIHVGTGPIFVLCWLFFNDASSARILAAVVPLGITLQFALVGAGVIKDPSAVDAMSRTGDRREILRGPLFYGIAFVALTLIFWRHSPVGIIALMILCGGDGLADLVGKRINSPPIPWSRKKSVAGSLTMLFGGFILAILVLWVFVVKGFFVGPITRYLLPIGVIAIVAVLVESLPFTDIDNLTVPFASVLLGLLVL